MEFLIHLAKSSLFLILFYVFYRVLLRYTTFFKLNRTYLLIALIISLVLPGIHISEEIALPEETVSVVPISPKVSEIEATSFQVNPESAAVAQKWSLERLLLTMYLIGTIVFLARFVKKLFSLSKLTRRYTDQYKGNIFVLPVSSRQNIGSFSFLGQIFMTRSDFEQHFERVYCHEKIHAKQLHSLDILLAELMQIVLWFNPVLILYKESLQEIHEFLADTSAGDRESYARFLVNYAMSGNHPAFITNKFYSSDNLKNRIQMLYRKKDSRYILARYLTVVPLVFLVVLLTASREYIYVAPQAPAVEPVSQSTTQLTEAPNPAETPKPNPPVTKATDLSETKVKGKVVESSSGSPLPGSILIIKGTTSGTTTNSDGEFEITLPDGHDQLVVSFVGYTSQIIRLGEEKNLTISLARENKQLDKVVVVGYGFLEKPATEDTMYVNSKTIPGSSKVFTAVEQMPEFPGGTNEMYKFLARHIRYPGEAARAHVQGQVYISFIVNKNGFVRNPKVIKSLGHGTDEEALRVVITMPRWKPAMQNGTPVEMEYTLPVQFQLETSGAVEKQGFLNTPQDQPTGNAMAESSTGTHIKVRGNDTPDGAHFSSPAELHYLREAPRMGHQYNQNAPLYLIDGKEYNPNYLDRIDPNTISSIEVRKDLATIEKYGSKAKNGVMLITTKNPVNHKKP